MSNAPLTSDRNMVSHDLAQQIRGVAVRMKKSGVVCSLDRPARHHTLILALAEWAGRNLPHSDFEQGFLTMTGKFIDRGHAARLCGRGGKLFSEDLW